MNDTSFPIEILDDIEIRHIGVYGRYPSTEFASEVIAEFGAAGVFATYYGPTTALSADHQDAVLIIDPSDKVNEIILQSVTAGIPTVTMGAGIDSPYLSRFEVPSFIRVYGSGTELVAALIRGTLRTGTLTVRGLPEDEYVLAHQSDVAHDLVRHVLGASFENTRSRVYSGEHSGIITMGELARQIFFGVQDYILCCENAGVLAYAHELKLPELVDLGRPHLEVDLDAFDYLEEHRFVEAQIAELSSDLLYQTAGVPTGEAHEYHDLTSGIRATIIHVVNDGSVEVPDSEDRYAIPETWIAELRNDLVSTVNKNEYLLRVLNSDGGKLHPNLKSRQSRTSSGIISRQSAQ